nr:retrovirus-related Pol polyprotein from transposon TNT 1-94 [Tanacetum cinerariifolium]
MHFIIHSDLIQWNDKRFIQQALIEIENVKSVVTSLNSCGHSSFLDAGVTNVVVENSANGKWLSQPFSKSITQACNMSSKVWFVLLLCPFICGCIWEALGRKTRDLGSVWEETGQKHNTWFLRAWRRDIQCVGSDIRPPMFDRTDFASWQQRIRFYCRGKENGVNILKSTDEGLFQMGMIRETLGEGEEGALHLGPEQARVYSDLLPEDKERMQLNSKFINNMLLEWGKFITAVKLNRGLKESNYDQLYAYLKQHEGRHNKGRVNNARGSGAVSNGGAQNRLGNVNARQARQIKCYNCNGNGHIARNFTQPKRPQNSEYFKDKILLMQAQENGVVLDEEQLLFIAGGQDNAVDEDVDEPPTMFMVNLSSVDPVYDEACPSYDLNILSKVHDHDNYQDAICELHEVHEMHDNVQPNYVVDSDADYTSDSNMISYDQYVKNNAEPVIQNNVSFVPNDASVMIINKMHEQTAQCVYVKVHTNVVEASLTAELAIYRKQVKLYERRTKFELT